MSYLSRVKVWMDQEVLEASDLNAEFNNITDNIVAGTTATPGVVQLEDSHVSTSTTKAACPKNVKEAYDLAAAAGGGDPSTAIHAASTKATPVDADELGLVDSAASWVLKKLTWVNLKATLKTYFDTLYNLYSHPNHTGAVISTGDGATAITDKAVTLAKMNDMATASLLGRNTAATGIPEVLSKTTAQSLLNVEDNADVTDAVNVGTSIHGVANKATPVNADKVPLIDTENGNVLKTSTWTNIKAFLKTYFDTLYATLAHKTRHQNSGADEINVGGLSGLLADDQHVLDSEVQAVSINNLSEDTTPQLGGELDAGAHSIGFTQQSTTGDGTTTIDWKLGNKFKFTFGAQNDTFTFTAPTKPCNLLLLIIQDATGSRTITWPAAVKWPGGTAPTLSTGAGAKDIVSIYYNGTFYFAQANFNFS